MKEVLYDEKHASILWDGKNKIMELVYKDHLSHDEYRDFLEKFLLFAIEKQNEKWISDRRGMKLIAPEDQDWLFGDWAIRASQLSKLKATAIVKPMHLFGKVASATVTKGIHDKTKFIAKEFEQYEDALEWLLHQVI